MKRQKKITLGKYSYVSLFGINSLDDLKLQLFQNSISSQHTSNDLASLAKKNIKSIFDTFNTFVKDTTKVNLPESMFRSLAFSQLSQTLICIDDIERRGKNLDVKDVIGLVSLLKEQKECKITLLLNEQQVGDNDYSIYREKVIDINLAFHPTPEECADIAFGGNHHHDILKKACVDLEIRNIRVLEKIKKLAKEILILSKDYEEIVQDNLISTISLFSWCHYCSGENKKIPPLAFVFSKEFSKEYYLPEEEKETDPTKKEWITKLHSYNFYFIDELDTVIENFVENGYLSESDFVDLANKKNNQMLENKSRENFRKAWDKYFYSFDDNAEEVISGIYNSFKSNIECLTRIDLQSAVHLLRQLDEGAKASALIDYFIDTYRDTIDIFKLQENDHFYDIKDIEILIKFKAVANTDIPAQNIERILARIADTNAWNPVDIKALSNASVDEYYQLFKLRKDHSIYIKVCLNFEKMSNAGDEEKEISSKARAALHQIGSECLINQLRVRRYGMEI